MPLSSWCILIGGGCLFLAYASVLAAHRRSFVGVLAAGVMLLFPILTLNQHHAPWGLCILLAVVGYCGLLGTVVWAVERRRRQR